MKADFEIHSGWGDCIEWMVNDWNKVDFSKDTLDVYGFLSNCPEEGQTILGHFKHSDILFKIISIEHESDPPDMFFAKVKAIDREMKKE